MKTKKNTFKNFLWLVLEGIVAGVLLAAYLILWTSALITIWTPSLFVLQVALTSALAYFFLIPIAKELFLK